MISSVNNFSAAAASSTGIPHSYVTNQQQQDEENRFLLPENKLSGQSSTENSSNTFSSSPNKQELTEEERKKVEELKKRDTEVRIHEQAHQSAAGSLSIGGASFDYQTGPDGKRYAVGGEVSIDTSKVAGDPQATIAKARQINRAALAPADPSGQDRQVAAQAVKMEAEANKELSSQRQENLSGSLTNSASPQTDFYKQIQSASAGNNGVSMLDYYA